MKNFYPWKIDSGDCLESFENSKKRWYEKCIGYEKYIVA